jgi:hypothetical protein
MPDHLLWLYNCGHWARSHPLCREELASSIHHSPPGGSGKPCWCQKQKTRRLCAAQTSNWAAPSPHLCARGPAGLYFLFHLAPSLWAPTSRASPCQILTRHLSPVGDPCTYSSMSRLKPMIQHWLCRSKSPKSLSSLNVSWTTS